MEGNIWFNRLVRECKQISPHIEFKRIKMGFYRVYFKEAYMHEVYASMPYHGYDIYEEDPRLLEKKYYEEFEDQAELTMKIKNYVEGYTDSIDKIRRRVWLYKNDVEFYNSARNAYKQMIVK